MKPHFKLAILGVCLATMTAGCATYTGQTNDPNDPNRTKRGALIGITLTTSREEVARAIIEAINFEMLINLERLNGSGIPVSEVRVVGGLSKSDLFLQLKSDIMGIPVTRIQTHEAGTLGIGILASVAVGHFSSLQEAVQSLVKTTDVFRPDPARHAGYLTKFERYKKLYPAIRPLFD